MKPAPRVYLDTCCLNRPFNDQGQDRIRLEAEAIIGVLRRIHSGRLVLLGSEALDLEVGQTKDEQRRTLLFLLLLSVRLYVPIDEGVTRRARTVESFGVTAFDALHVASAEKGRAAVLLTTDDRFLGKAARVGDQLAVLVTNPVEWFYEVNRT